MVRQKPRKINAGLKAGNEVFSVHQTIHGIRVSSFKPNQSETNIEDDHSPTRRDVKGESV
jgi:hypothetical protein